MYAKLNTWYDCVWAEYNNSFYQLQSVYMDGIRMFGIEQLQEIVDLMMEKEIRVQLPVEELDILNDSWVCKFWFGNVVLNSEKNRTCDIRCHEESSQNVIEP